MHRWIKGVLIGLATGVSGALFALTPIGTEFEQDLGLAWLFQLRGVRAGPSEVVVVGINADSGRRLGLDAKPRSWPRTIHAEVIQNLVRLGAEVIVFDMDFNRAKHPQDDRIFADTVQGSNRIVLFERLTGKRQPLVGADGTRQGWYWVERTLPPLDIFANAARGIGPFPLPKLEEALFQFWTFKPSARNAATMPSVALQLYAMTVYDDLVELLRADGAAGVEDLPAESARLDTARSLQEAMRAIRQVFGAAPGLADRLRDRVRRMPESELPERERRLLNALISLYAGADDRFVNFYGPPGSVSTVPFQDFATGVPYLMLVRGAVHRIPADGLDLSGKVVFVGYSDLFDPEQPDRFYTVFTQEDGVDLSGVEVAASAFANLVTESAIEPVSNRVTALIILVFGLLIAGGVYLYPALLAIPSSLLIAVAYGAGVQWLFNGHSQWLPIATPILIQLPLAVFVGLFAQYLLERRQKERMTEAVAHYLPESAAQLLVKEGFTQEALDKVWYATCFATDMSGFTALSETMKPDEVAHFLNRYFEALTGPLNAHGVDVTEFRTDGIMCAWTAETPEAVDHESGVLAALDATLAIRDFNESSGRPPLNFRVGLDKGPVYIGHAGGGGRMAFTIVGDAANTASRVEGLNKILDTHVLATQRVAENLTRQLLRPLGRFVFVGKGNPIAVYEVLAADQEPVGEPVLDLCASFADALAAFQSERWTDAAAAFGRTLESFPGDGPSKFYLNLITRYLTEGVPDAEPAVVRLESK